MTKWNYPDTIKNIKESLHLFLLGDLSIDKLQSSLHQAEQQIDSYEESWLRSLFFDAENRIEEIRFTFSEDDQVKPMMSVAELCLSKIYNHENQN